MVVEFLGGIFSGSLALMADGGHMLSDAGSIGLALFALWLTTQPSGTRHTYGFHRTEILAATINGAALVAISVLIFIEAWERLLSPTRVQAPILILVAVGGLVVNLIGLWLLNDSREESLNMRGAWLHILADTLGSIQAISAGMLIWFFDWYWADPLASIIIALLIIVSAWWVLRESVTVLMESSPMHIDVGEVLIAMKQVEGAADVHDLHVWTITSGMVALSAHVQTESKVDRDDLLKTFRSIIRKSFSILHATNQIESLTHECQSCS